MIVETDAMAKDQRAIMALCMLLVKLRVAGFKKRSISLASTLTNKNWSKPGKYVFKLAVISTSLDYLVMVPYRDADILK